VSNLSETELQIGDLLLRLELITSAQLHRALSISSSTALPIGKSLVALDFIDERILIAVIEMQSMLRDGLIDFPSAKEAMRKVVAEKRSLPEALWLLGIHVSDERRNRLGEMLVEAGLVKIDQLDFGLAIAQSSGLPLGQVLVLLNRISESVLRLALALQREVRARSIDRAKAIAKLAKGSAGGDTIDNLAQAVPPYKVRLGKLIFLAGLITHEMLLTALRASRISRRLLGQYLIENKLISAEQLNLALCLQRLVWEGRITHTAAARLLKNACEQERKDSPETPGRINLDDDFSVSFCDFLCMSGYLTQEKIDRIVETMPYEPKLMALVFRQSPHERALSDEGRRRRLVRSLSDPAIMRYALNKTFPKDQHLINSALILFTLSASKAITLAQALVNFGVEWNAKTLTQATASSV